MNKTMEYRGFVAKSRMENRYVFEVGDTPGFGADAPESYIEWLDIRLLGIPSIVTDNDMDRIYSGDDEGLISVADLYGCIIMCEQIINDGYDTFTVCDDISADLGYAISALQEPGAALNKDDGNPWYNVLYIHEITFCDDGYDPAIFQRIVEELPYIIREFTNVKTEVLAYYPSPIKHDWMTDQEKSREFQINRIIAERTSKMLKCDMDISIEDAESKPHSEIEENNVTKLPVEYQLDEDDIMRYLGQRVPGSIGYPAEYKDVALVKRYTDCGFVEAGESRLLYKHTIFSLFGDD